MAWIFECTDPLGRLVRLEDKWWRKHVIEEKSRRFLDGQEDAVRKTITDPYYITDSHTHIDRDLYYLPFVLAPPHQMFYLKVVVSFSGGPNPASMVGFIVTAHPTDDLHPKENVKWKR